MNTPIQEHLITIKDDGYAAFHRKLIPTVEPQTVLGVRAPALRQYAKELFGSAEGKQFLSELPHHYYDENMLHGLMLCRIKDFDECLAAVEIFLPYVDNWAVCDSLSPAVFKKEADKLLPAIDRWLASDAPYTVRFGIKCLMNYFLDERFKIDYADKVAAVKSDEYYVNMMIAWYFATALAKQYDAVLPYFRDKKLAPWIHNKAIQKARESRRVDDGAKAYLKTLKRVERPSK